MDTKITTKDGLLSITHWNKNEEQIQAGKSQRYLKHQNYYSYTSHNTKKGALIGTWTRIQTSTMHKEDLLDAVVMKSKELYALHYPKKKILRSLAYMHKKHQGDLWDSALAKVKYSDLAWWTKTKNMEGKKCASNGPKAEPPMRRLNLGWLLDALEACGL